ncbi:MAG: hypothetical protein RLZZ597_548 [Cyanobacteriota bacterium]
MSLKNRAKATAKNIEGKVEEFIGDMTDNHEAQVKGKAKQAEAKVRSDIEDTKDEVKKALD